MRFSIALFAAALFLPSAVAQYTTASLGGAVGDSTGASVPEAKVSLIWRR